MRFLTNLTMSFMFCFFLKLYKDNKKKLEQKRSKRVILLSAFIFYAICFILAGTEHYLEAIIIAIILCIVWRIILSSTIDDEQMFLMWEKSHLANQIETLIALRCDFVPQDIIEEYRNIMLNKIASVSSYKELEDVQKVCEEILDYLFKINKDRKRTGEFETKYNNKIYNNETLKALNLFKLSTNTNENEIKKQYRQLVKKMHPDKGGNPIDFMEIQNAYNVLKKSYNIN